MSELTAVIQELLQQADAGRPCALCTVVKTKGSTPQSPGASMLLRCDCSTVGTLGGGCVEEEVKSRAYQAVSTGDSALHDFLLNHDYGWDDGLICGGRMDIAVMAITPQTDLEPFRQALSSARQCTAATVPLEVQHEGKPLRYRLHLEPPLTLLVAGAGHVGQAIAGLTVDLDFKVVVIDDRAEYAARERFDPRVKLVVEDIALALKNYDIDGSCYVVIVTRGHQHDQQALEAVIHSSAGYIGLIGSKRKAKLIMEDLRARGVPEDLIGRVRTPIGLSIGAVTVPEIAISIAAELVEHRRKTTPQLIEGPLENQE